MAITYKKIAEIVGVSRATVDRVMHNRGHVKPELEQRIREVAREYGFQPSHVGRALAKAKNPVKIGVLVHLSRISFFQRVLEGVNAARDEIANLGGEVLVCTQESFDASAQMAALDEMVAAGVQGIAISPAQDICLRDRLSELIHVNKIPVVTFNTDMDNLDRLTYVGVDNAQVGRTGAYLMDLLLRGNGGNIMIISGFLTQQTNYKRVEGFLDECATYYPRIHVVGLDMTYDEDERAYDVTRKALQDHPDMNAIFMVSSGQVGCCRALEDAGRAGEVKLIIVDSLPETDEYLRKGVIDLIIDQDAYAQGSLPPRILFDYLFSGKEPEQNLWEQIGIKTRYTV